MRGDLANHIALYDKYMGLYENAPKEDLKKQIAIQDKIIEQINFNNPSFFENFKTGILDGKHLTIQKQLKKAFNELQIAAFQIPEIKERFDEIDVDWSDIDNDAGLAFSDDEALNRKKLLKATPEEYHELLDHTIASDRTNQKSPNVAAAIACAVYFVVVAHNAVFVTVAVFMAGVFAGGLAVTFTLPEKAFGSDSSLQSELLIDQIAELAAFYRS